MATSFYAVLMGLHTLVWALLKCRPSWLLSSKPHLAAHFPCVFIAFCSLNALGIQFWFISPDASLAATRATRTSTYSAEGELLTALMVGFQLYEISCCVFEKKLRGDNFEMIAHHFAALLLSVLGLEYVYLHYYAPFFFGLVELSSIPLSVMDLFKDFKPLQKVYPTLFELSRSIFAVIFLVVRVGYWPVVSYLFWCDSLDELAAGSQPKPLVYTFCVCNVVLTSLQLFWGWLVAKGLWKALFGKKDDKDGYKDD